jgi:hypothetical protein
VFFEFIFSILSLCIFFQNSFACRWGQLGALIRLQHFFEKPLPLTGRAVGKLLSDETAEFFFEFQKSEMAQLLGQLLRIFWHFYFFEKNIPSTGWAEVKIGF